MRKLCLLVFASMTMLFSLQAYSQGMVTGVIGKSPIVKTYEEGGGRETGQIEVARITFPAPILEKSDSNFVRIKVGDQAVWLDGTKLKIDASLEVDCKTAVKSNFGQAAGGSRGANKTC